MRKPRDLFTTLPSPSEMNNFHTCPCYWYLKDRLWIKPIRDRDALLAGRFVDKVMDTWHREDAAQRNPSQVLAAFDGLVNEHRPLSDPGDYDAFMVGARDALGVWLTLYGRVVEKVTHVQPKMPWCRGKVDYIVEVSPGIVRVRERKLLSPFEDVDDEVAKYQLGFQPLAYAADVEQTYEVVVECVEFEFLVRSAPQRGRYKAIPASVRREPVYVDDWKKRLWEASATYTNEFMRWVEGSLPSQAPFEVIPRHTRNCLVKLGKKIYPCDFYVACKTNTNPVTMEEHFVVEGESREEAKAA